MIFWKPTGYTSWDGGAPYSANYKSIIGTFFADLAAASGALSNIYGALTQYCNGPREQRYELRGPAGRQLHHHQLDIRRGGRRH